MTTASMPETNSAKPKSPPAPSSGAPPASTPPVSQERSPSRRAMNPSTLMPRKTEPVKEAFMQITLPEAYDGSPRLSAVHSPGLFGGSAGQSRRRPVQADLGVTGGREVVVVGHAEHHSSGERRPQV